MHVLLKKDVDIKKISIYFNQNYNFYKIYYNLEYIKLLGLVLSKIIKLNNLLLFLYL